MAGQNEKYDEAIKEAHKCIEKLGDRVPPQARHLIEETFAKMKVDRMLLKDALGFSPELMEATYQRGYKLFQNGKYQEALKIFNILRQLDITDKRYSFAIAACYHYTQQYLDAAANYLIYQYMDPLNPVPAFHLYDCYLKANYPLSALYAIQEALVLASSDPKYANLKDKIQIEANYLENVLKDRVKNKQEQSA
jgi:type III secretion system low calcium response chaperone LcrH/SycD